MTQYTNDGNIIKLPSIILTETSAELLAAVIGSLPVAEFTELYAALTPQGCTARTADLMRRTECRDLRKLISE